MKTTGHTLKASFIIPAYNEEKNIGKTVTEVQKAFREHAIPYEIIIVNDNSSDGTRSVIQELMQEDSSIRTVDREPPGGFGRAVRAGLELVEGDVVIIYMADLSDDPQDALAYYRKIEEGYDCVFGSRFRKGSRVENYPSVKLAVNRIVNRLIQFLFWCPFNDLTNAFKAYRTEVVRDCGPYRASHFNITIEMSLSALVRKYHVAEIPICWYGRTWGSSNLAMTQMGRRYLSTLLKVFFEKTLIADDLLAERLARRTQSTSSVSGLQDRVNQLEAKIKDLESLRSSQPKPPEKETP